MNKMNKRRKYLPSETEILIMSVGVSNYTYSTERGYGYVPYTPQRLARLVLEDQIAGIIIFLHGYDFSKFNYHKFRVEELVEVLEGYALDWDYVSQLGGIAPKPTTSYPYNVTAL